MRIRTVLLPAISLALVATACGGDDDSTTPPPLGEVDATVEVLAEDISFPEDVYETTAGRIGFVYENVGSIRHTLVIEGISDFKLNVNKNGRVDQAAIDLEPGTYTLFCDIPGHRAAGMVADLVVS
ncbi:sulfocyanin-like copper-binding protein [Actinospongicola halichondriae]|uniref:sulfocyanin-like copper-binding protein n=1 Tax=Actinospongicola halichondriae TaxID=3236844 RepID=UPI003D57E2C3